MRHISYTINENLKHLSDKALLEQTDLLAKEYRSSTILLLRHLREVEVRRLFVEVGFSSMHKYCLQRLKFSEGEAQRRLASARLFTELPEIEKQIESGELNVTNLSKIQSFLRVEKAANHSLSKNQKLELIEKMENKSTREVEKELVGLSHQPALMAEKLHCSQMDSQFMKFEALLGKEQQELLTEFKNFYAHDLSDFADGAILAFLLKKAVHYKKKKLGLMEDLNSPSRSNKKKTSYSVVSTPEASASVTNAAPLPSAPKVAPRMPQRKYIKASIKKAIWQRAKACCEFEDPQSHKRCGSKYALELDHIKPLALGGSDEIENLQLLCRMHNSRRAVKTFGASVPKV